MPPLRITAAQTVSSLLFKSGQAELDNSLTVVDLELAASLKQLAEESPDTTACVAFLATHATFYFAHTATKHEFLPHLPQPQFVDE